jgi:hypothetical protein
LAEKVTGAFDETALRSAYFGGKLAAVNPGEEVTPSDSI